MASYAKVVQISDSHCYADQSARHKNCVPYANLATIVKHICQHEQPDLILFTGDLSQDGSVASYQHLATLMSKTAIPTAVIAGNHDHPENLAQYFVGENIYHKQQLLLKNWQIILLDSVIPNQEGGQILNDQFKYLRQQLAINHDHPTMVVCHHHPIPCGNSELDRMMLANADEFNQIVQSQPQIKAVLFGHIHQNLERQLNGVHYLGCPQTASAENPAYRCLRLLSNGQLNTTVKYLPVAMA